MSNRSIVVGSLLDIAQQEGKSMAETFIGADVVILIDTSGSMCARDASGGRSRHEAAADELRRLQERFPGKVAVIAFSDDAVFCPGGVPIRLDGGTAMARALQFIKVVDGAGVKLFLISDGEPNSKEETLRIARTFETKIDTIFIGAEDRWGREGRAFLIKLAQATGGQNLQSDGIGLFADPVERKLLIGGAQ